MMDPHWYLRRRNIVVTPLVPIRATVLIIAYALLWVGERLEAIGGAVPGWTRYP